MNTRDCVTCGGPIRGKGKLYCSPKCNNSLLKNRVTVYCLGCGAQKEKTPAEVAVMKPEYYCAPCHVRKRTKTEPRKCAACGAIYTPAGTRRSTYCSVACYKAATSICERRHVDVGGHWLIEIDKGKWTKVCKCHYDLVKGYAWYYTKRGYVEYNRKGYSAIKLHRLINNTPEGFLTDHINRDPLDNRCSNLRPATKAQNNMNRGIPAHNTSGFRGVNKDGNTWYARLTHAGVLYERRGFTSKAEAAKAYNELAKKHFGEFAWLNPV